MSEPKKRGGWRNPAAAENGRKATGGGRPPTRAVINTGDGVLVSQVYPDGGYVDLGRGKVAIEGRGRSRIVLIPQDDGSVIRIVIPR